MQLAHLEIVTKAGRTLAPQLKIIISSWMKSLFDQYPPAASAAKKSFDTTFPDDKKKSVISFCKKDLLVVCTFMMLNLRPLVVKFCR